MVKKRFIYFCLLSTLFFCIDKKMHGLFTLESSQNALVSLKAIQVKLVEVLRYLLLASTGYQAILDDQKNIWGQVKVMLTEVPVEIEKIIIKLRIVEKDNQDYVQLINQLFLLLNQMTAGVEMYSTYLSSLDQGILKVLEAQKQAAQLVATMNDFCQQNNV
jgi:hypothetical protein